MRKAFSMIELVFVIIIIGALSATAMTWLISTRNDSAIAMIRSDISTIFKQVSARVIAENINITSNKAPTGYSNWGEWLMDTPHLDKSRWYPTQNGLRAIIRVSSSSNTNSNGSFDVCIGDYLYIDNKQGLLIFIPNKINTTNKFCKLLADSYKNTSNFTINLSTNNKVIF